jgi:uncharacterized membrane protein YccF (DUF307 family)
VTGDDAVLRLIGNVLWFVLGGVWMGLAWWLVGLVALISVVGIPWAKACFMLGQFAFFPFGMDAVNRRLLYGRDDVGTGAVGVIGNVIWFFGAGLWIAIGHVLTAVACCVTIIGIPFGVQHLKFAGLALAPIGLEVVPLEVARAARTGTAFGDAATLRRLRLGAR